VNKAQLIEALAERLGDKKTASQAVEGVVDLIVRNVNKGEKVNITGFGVFEKRARAARTARNPRTGEAVKVKKTNVPAFRAGTQFKEVVGGTRKLPRATSAKAGAAKSTTRGATKTTTTRAGKSAATTKTAATRATAARSAAKTGTRATTAKTTAAKPARKTTTTRRSTKK
jgi:DNA-binding protein HU-beta